MQDIFAVVLYCMLRILPPAADFASIVSKNPAGQGNLKKIVFTVEIDVYGPYLSAQMGGKVGGFLFLVG